MNCSDTTGKIPGPIIPWLPEGIVDWLGEMISQIPSKEEHYQRNENNIVPDEDELMEIVNNHSDFWIAAPALMNMYHRFTFGEQGQDAIYNKKYMSADGRYEVIICYDPVNVPIPYIVTDPLNLGTYNYGTDAMEHLFRDMIPYWRYGNSPEDTTTRPDRFFGRI